MGNENAGAFKKIGPMKLPSRIADGTFNLYFYEFGVDRRFVVLEKGEARGRPNVLVRVESNCVWAHVFGSARCDCAEQTHDAMRRIIREGSGLLIHAYDQDGRGLSLYDHVLVYMYQDQGFDSVDADRKAGFEKYDRRSYGDVIDILRDWELKSMRLLTNNPDRLSAISSQFPVERVAIESVALDKWNAAQIFTKKSKMGHLFSFDVEDPETKQLAEFSITEGSWSEYEPKER